MEDKVYVAIGDHIYIGTIINYINDKKYAEVSLSYGNETLKVGTHIFYKKSKALKKVLKNMMYEKNSMRNELKRMELLIKALKKEIEKEIKNESVENI